MERIFFEGGDKDGKTLDLSEDLEDQFLLFDGSGGLASPKGKYVRTEEQIVFRGEARVIWRLLP